VGVCSKIGIPTKERSKMAIFEFSDDFDAQGWYLEQMQKGYFRDDYYEEY
jgi:hypothetical protein